MTLEQEAKPGDKPLLFVSYSREQKQTAEDLTGELRELGYDTWRDLENIGSGLGWLKAIDDALRACDAVVALLSRASAESEWVLKEFFTAQQYKRPLIIIELEPCTLPFPFSDLNRLIPKSSSTEHILEPIQQELSRYYGRKAAEPASAAPTSLDEGEDETPSRIEPIRKFRTGMRIRWIRPDDEGKVWISDGKQVRIFRLDRPDPIRHWLLPNRPWKHVFDAIWCGRVLCADWYGALYAYDPDEPRDGMLLREPRYSDLPVHQIALGADDRIYAATWDGHVFGWNSKGEECLAPRALPRLPTHLVPLPDGGLGVIDEGGVLRWYDPDGTERARWDSGSRIRGAWSYVGGPGKTAFQMLTYGNDVLEAREGKPIPTRLPIDGAIEDYTLRPGRPTDPWIALALRGSRLQWFSGSAMRALDTSVQLPGETRCICAQHALDPRSDILSVLGLSHSGQLFSTDDNEVRTYTSEPYQDFVLDRSGHFLFCCAGQKLHAFRNPAIAQSQCSVRVTGVNSSLRVGSFGELLVEIANDGLLPIRRLKAQVKGGKRVEAAEFRYETRLVPGQGATLDLSAQALVPGKKVPMTLEFQLEDDAGPPAVVVTHDMSVEVVNG